MRHIEFFHKDHFEQYYHRTYPGQALNRFVDFFWETRFESLLKQHPKGFSDILFPNLGYTYLINLGTPFIMQLGEKKFKMKTHGFLPRHVSLECYHQPGNRIFGIKFRISPIIFQKKIDFSEYREYIFPLSYLLDKLVIDKIKKAPSFEARVKIAATYFETIIHKHDRSLRPIEVVTSIVHRCSCENNFTISIDELARQNKISTRTLQRYFEKTTGVSSKTALQILRIRKAVSHLASSPKDFHFSLYGYYDQSHFYKHLREFFRKDSLKKLQPHIKLLELSHN